MTDTLIRHWLRMSRPFFGEEELESIREVLDSGWLGEGRKVAEFEEKLKAFTGAGHVIAVNTGTAALHLALHVHGVGPGDEVILPSSTFVSDPQAVLMTGAKPVFADIEAEHWNLDPEQVARVISPKTKAIMPTDYAGVPSDTERIRDVLGNREIKIIRDGAHSFGSRVCGRVIGSWQKEDATCFSFDPIKNLTAGDGGAVLVNKKEAADRLRNAKSLGRLKGEGHVEPGYRYQMNELNAAIGLVQLERFGEMAARKQALARCYDEHFADYEPVQTPARDYSQIVPFMYVVRVPAKQRRPLIDWLDKQGITAGLRYAPCHHEPLFGQTHLNLPVTERISAELISLPLYPQMQTDDVAAVAAACHEYFDRHAK